MKYKNSQKYRIIIEKFNEDSALDTGLEINQLFIDTPIPRIRVAKVPKPKPRQKVKQIKHAFSLEDAEKLGEICTKIADEKENEIIDYI